MINVHRPGKHISFGKKFFHLLPFLRVVPDEQERIHVTETGIGFDNEINNVIPLFFEIMNGFQLIRGGFVNVASWPGTDQNRVMILEVLDDLRIQIQFLHPFDRFGFLHLASRIHVHFHFLFLLRFLV